MIARASSMLAALVMAGCAAQGPTLNVQAEQMELALVECKAQLGLAGQLKTEVSFAGGIATAVAVPFDQISAADAVRINACANGAEALNDGLLVVPMTAVAPVAVASPVRAVEPTRAVAAAPVSNGPCPAGYRGMYGGTLYCTGAN